MFHFKRRCLNMRRLSIDLNPPKPQKVTAHPYPRTMPDYKWSPPEHPDPPEDQPLGAPADEAALTLTLFPAVWVTVDMTRTGRQRLPGFVMAASETVVHVQFVHMGNAHRVWLPRDRVTNRVLKRIR